MADHDTHDHTGVTGVGDMSDPMTTRGDIIIRNASNVTARLGRGSSGQVLQSDGTDIAWQTPSGGSLTSFEEVLSGDVTMTTNGTYYDGPSHSCAAGTWLFVWSMTFTHVSSLVTDYFGRLWDGSTTWDERAQLGAALSTTNTSLGGQAIVVLGGTTTVKISGTADRNAEVMARDIFTSSASSHTATKLVGLKIA